MSDMAGETAALERQSSWIDQMRAQGRRERTLGLIACLAGVMILIIGRFRLGGPIWMLWTGSAVVALGWGLFVYALVRRLNWVRAHPFESNG
jgi:hypothetical protein